MDLRAAPDCGAVSQGDGACVVVRWHARAHCASRGKLARCKKIDGTRNSHLGTGVLARARHVLRLPSCSCFTDADDGRLRMRRNKPLLPPGTAMGVGRLAAAIRVGRRRDATSGSAMRRNRRNREAERKPATGRLGPAGRE